MQPTQYAEQDTEQFMDANGTTTTTHERLAREQERDAGLLADDEGRGLADVIGALVPSGCIEQDVHFDIARTSAALADALERALRPHGLTSAQFNVLRILRAADAEGLCRNALRERLPTRMPDVTRLLDRMEAAGLVTRERSPLDRRLVTTRITPRGRRMVDELEAEVRTEHQRRLGHLEPRQLRTLVDLLALVRSAVEPVPARPRR